MKQTLSAFVVLALILSGITVMSCHKDNNSTPPKPTLYDTLGGTAMVNDPANSGTKIEAGRLAVRSVVDSSALIIAADSRINGFFTVLLSEVKAGNTSGLSALSKNLTDFICVGAGAKNFTYGGKSMTAAHDPAQNSRMNGKAATADFNNFEADVVAGANKNKVPANIIASLGNLLESVRAQVVQK